MRTPSASSVSAPPLQRRRRAVAVLDHRHPGRGHHDRRHRRQVHRVGSVATGADHVDGVVADVFGGHPPGVLSMVSASSVTSADVGRFIFIDTPKAGDLRRGRRAGHDLVHRPGRLPRHAAAAAWSAGRGPRPCRGVGCRVKSRRQIMTNCLDPGGVEQLQSVILAGVTSAVGTSGTAITSRVHSLNRPNMVSVGTIVWLSSELMFFAGLFAMYFTARVAGRRRLAPHPTELNLYQAVPVTLVLIASSFTCQMGVFAAERGDVFGLRRWYVITFLMGAVLRARPGLRVHPPRRARHHDLRAAPTARSSTCRPASTACTSSAA